MAMSKTKEEVRQILVIRSAPLPRTFEALKKLREEYPNAEISVLVQEEVKTQIEESRLVDRVIVGIKKGRIGLIRNLPLILRLRRETYDLVAIIYNTKDISWYGNLRLFTFAIKVRERIGITIENVFQIFKKKEIFFKDFCGPNLKLALKPLKLIFAIPMSVISMILVIISLVPLILFYHLRRGLKRSKA
jgi:hypothetical protein